MKKSIYYCLMSMVALLFCGTAFAQHNTANWPAKGAWNALTSTNVVKHDGFDVARVDTIYFCSDKDSVYPIELGYDVAHLNLHPTYGDWSLYAATETGGDYQVTAAKNGGAGNVFSIIQSGKQSGPNAGVGAYIFRYDATSEQCGLLSTSNALVYVFVLPKLSDTIVTDTTVCKNEVLAITPSSSYPLEDLFNKADITIGAWTPNTWTIPTANVGSTTYISSAPVTGPKKYKCGGTFTQKLVVKVIDNATVLAPISAFTCDTSDVFAQLNVHDLLRTSTPGAYLPAKVGKTWLPGPGVNEFHKLYSFTTTLTCVTAKTVVDSIIFGRAFELNGVDSLVACRSQFFVGTNTNIYSLFPAGSQAAGYNHTNSILSDQGITITPPNPIVLGPKGSVFVTDKWVSVDKMGTNIPYYFKYTVTADNSRTNCNAGSSAYFMFKVKDKELAKDLRAQFCNEFIGGTKSFDLNVFASIAPGSAKWTYLSVPGIATGTEIPSGVIPATDFNANNLTIGTHKLGYKLASSCGDSTSAVMYLKISGSSIIPEKITQTFCKLTPPSSINTNEILGFNGIVSGASNVWELTAATIGGVAVPAATLTALTGMFNPATGSFPLGSSALALLDVQNITEANPATLVFTLKGRTCAAIAGDNVLTIKITDNILR